MKETVKTFVIVVLVLLVVLLSVTSMKYYQKSQEKPSQPVIITDTITNVVYDTVYLERYNTVKLRTTDTTVYYITDTVKRVDSIEVEVPISVYKLDTTFFTDSTSLNIHIQNSGYEVTLDSLSYYFEYTPRLQKKTHWFIGPSLGIGYDFTTGKFVPTVGIGLIIKRF